MEVGSVSFCYHSLPSIDPPGQASTQLTSNTPITAPIRLGSNPSPPFATLVLANNGNKIWCAWSRNANNASFTNRIHNVLFDKTSLIDGDGDAEGDGDAGEVGKGVGEEAGEGGGLTNDEALESVLVLWAGVESGARVEL